MIKTRIFTAFAAVALIGAGGAPAFAKAQESQANGAPGASSSKTDRKICKRLENTGTRLRNDRICLTQSQWKKVEEQN